jgi:hypothetical protein
MNDTTTTNVSVPLVQAIQNAWSAIQTQNPDVPDVVITLGTGRVSQGMKLGHFAASVWTRGDGADVHELFVGAEGLSRGAQALMGTLLHEAGHAMAEQRGVQDTSRQGRYHNRKFQAIAQELGIEVTHDESLGWSSTTMPDDTAAIYSEAIMDLDAAMVAYRYGLEGFTFGTPTAGGAVGTSGTIRLPKVTTGRKSNNNGISASCGCGRKIRVSRSTLELGSIACGICGEAFTE